MVFKTINIVMHLVLERVQFFDIHLRTEQLLTVIPRRCAGLDTKRTSHLGSSFCSCRVFATSSLYTSSPQALTKDEPIMLSGIARKKMPVMMVNALIILPPVVTGYKSPYPTVVNVTMFHLHNLQLLSTQTATLPKPNEFISNVPERGRYRRVGYSIANHSTISSGLEQSTVI